MTHKEIKRTVALFISVSLIFVGCGSLSREYYGNRLKPEDPILQRVRFTVDVEFISFTRPDLTRTLLPPITAKARVLKSEIRRIHEGSLILMKAPPFTLDDKETLAFDEHGRYLGLLPE